MYGDSLPVKEQRYSLIEMSINLDSETTQKSKTTVCIFKMLLIVSLGFSKLVN